MGKSGRYERILNVNTGQWCVMDWIEQRALTIDEINELENEFKQHSKAIDSVNEP